MAINWGKMVPAAVMAAVGMLAIGLNAENVTVKDGDRVAVVGDSITEQKQYSRFIEAYILACAGLKDAKVMQFGWGGEQAYGFVNRMENDTMAWKPTVVTTCYGMNDGRYRAYDEKAIGTPYRQNMEKIVKYFKDKGVKIIVGTPGVVDSGTWRDPKMAAVYNENLGQLAKIDREIAAREDVGFADLHDVMKIVMEKAKAANGVKYHVAGSDGVHPGGNGQLVMAYAFLKAMGFDGKIATITMDFKGQTQVSAGLKVLSQKPGMAEIESSRYPFCFSVNPKNDKDPSSTAGILPFLPFQQELNRYELKVTDLPTDKAEVVWGKEKKVFTRTQLESGINLAAEFLNNPFTAKFNQLLNELWTKQNFETWMIKGMITNYRGIKGNLPEAATDAKLSDSLTYLRAKLVQKQEMLDAKVKKAITPVKYQITVTPVK